MDCWTGLSDQEMIKRDPKLANEIISRRKRIIKELEEKKKNQKFYAGIGSRKTPQHIMDQMVRIGKYLAENGYILRSGGANGADTAFEEGCDQAKGEKEIYLPWKNFNKNPSLLHFNRFPMHDFKGKAFEIAEEFHPKWDSLQESHRLLIARNSFQVLGSDLETPVRFVVCWTPFGWKPGCKAGGTGQALRIAHKEGIKIFDLHYEETIVEILDRIALGIDFLEDTSYDLFKEEKL